MRLWIKHPLSGMPAGAEGGMVVEDQIIAAFVAADEQPLADAVFDASAHVVLPGLINTHHHFYQTLTRAYPAAVDRKLFDWLTALYPVWARMTASEFRLAARLALAELLLSGCTTAADHHYLFPPGLPDAIDIELQEAASLGIRAVLCRGSMDLSTEDGGLPPPSVTQDIDTILADGERLAKTWHQRGPGAMRQIALAPCSPFSVSTALMRETAKQAEALDLRLHTHLAETEDENAFCMATFGKRPLDYLEDLGWISNRSWFAHGIHFNGSEIHRLGKAGCCVAHCPSSNMLLGSGICPAGALEAAGVGVGLAPATFHDPIRWATVGSARCLGREDLGRIAPGYQADLAFFKLDELRFSGAGDPLAALITCGAHRADRVMVGGHWRVIDGAIPGLDLTALLASHQAASRRIQSG
jgi:8-oxoguanine deaminase